MQDFLPVTDTPTLQHYDLPTQVGDPAVMVDGAQYYPQDLPLIPGAQGAAVNSAVKVSTQAIKVFLANLRQVEQVVRAALDPFNGDLTLRAGAFQQASLLRTSITDAGGLVDTTRTVLTQTLDTLMTIDEACGKIINNYETADELNNIDAAKFADLVSDANAQINNLDAQQQS
jgi:hypothetical protein